MLHKIIDFCCIRCEYFRKKKYMTVYAKSHIQHENVQSMLVNVALPIYENKATPHLTFNMKIKMHRACMSTSVFQYAKSRNTVNYKITKNCLRLIKLVLSKLTMTYSCSLECVHFIQRVSTQNLTLKDITK